MVVVFGQGRLAHLRLGSLDLATLSLGQLLVNAHLLLDEHVELHVAAILLADVHSVHGDVAIASRTHTDRRCCAAADDAHDGEDHEQERVSLTYRSADTGQSD